MGTRVSIAQLAKDTLARLDAQHWKSAHIVGNLFVWLDALEVALAARARVQSLALPCTFARGGEATRLTPARQRTGSKTRIGTREQRRRARLTMYGSTPSCANWRRFPDMISRTNR
jgi:hypothetical protein